MNRKIAILSTGSELITGDILSTNGQYAANALQDHGFSIGMHLCVTDDQKQIEEAYHFLLKHHKVVITSGGLGPTSDDVTRFALSNVIQSPLVFYPESMERITQQLQIRHLTCPENNRVQALFPEQAEILPNKNGTADGCAVPYKDHWIYLLPGPPREFIPLFDELVLRHLLKQPIHEPIFKVSWLLLNVSESHIAAELDPLIPSMPDAELAYRVYYPYLEIKIRTSSQHLTQQYTQLIEDKVKPFVVSHDKETASTQLKNYIKKIKQPILISDHATGGILESSILDAQNYAYIRFSQHVPNDFEGVYFNIQGLHNFWENPQHPVSPAEIQIKIQYQSKIENIQLNIPVHTNNPRLYAAETCSWMLLSYLKEHYGS